MKSEEADVSVTIRGIPAELHRKWRLLCMRRGCSQTQFFLDVLERAVEGVEITKKEAPELEARWKKGGRRR